MSEKNQKRLRKDMLNQIKDSLPELEEVSKLEKKVKRKRKLSLITDDLLKKVRNSPDPIEAVKNDPELRALAAATVREAARKTVGMRHYDVQVLGGLELGGKATAANNFGLKRDMKGNVVEMRTGEGKTLTATLPLYLGSLLDEGAWLITVNDYLARRDAEWMGPVYSELGRSVGVLTPRNKEKLHPSYVYEADEAYADLVTKLDGILADNPEERWKDLPEDALKRGYFTEESLEMLVEGGIITQEAKQPLAAISFTEDKLTTLHFEPGMSHEAREKHVREVLPFSEQLQKGVHYTADRKLKRATLTKEGVDFLVESGLIKVPEEGLHSRWFEARNIAWGIQHDILYKDMPHLKLVTRDEAYAADITYSPSHQVVFDWMGDNLAKKTSDQVQRQNLPGFVLLDEVDYILIDDARTPHIITGKVPSPYKFYEGFFPPVKQGDKIVKGNLMGDFKKYEWDPTRLRQELGFAGQIRDLAVKLIGIKEFGEEKTGAVSSQRKAAPIQFDIALSEGLEGFSEDYQAKFRQAVEHLEESVHWEREILTGNIGHTYKLTDEGYQFLCEQNIIKHPFNIDEMEKNKDPMKLGKMHHFFNQTSLPMHYVGQTHHFVFQESTKELWLTELGKDTLRERGVLPPEEIVLKCGEISLLVSEELLPLKHEDKKQEQLENLLDEIDAPLRDAFGQFIEGLHYKKRRAADDSRDEFEVTEAGYMHLFNYGAIPHPSPDASAVAIERGATNILRATQIYQRNEDYAILPDEEGKPKIVLVDKHSGRYMHGRRLSDGLHEAIEASWGIPVEKGGAETQKISQQMFYELFPWVAGMTGTAMSSWKEFEDVYELVAKALPTNIQWRWVTGELEREGKPHPVLDDNGKEIFTLEEVVYTDPETGEQFFERLDHPDLLVGAISKEVVEQSPDIQEDLMMYNQVLGRNKGNLLTLTQFTHYTVLIEETLDRIGKGQPVLLHTVDPNVSMDLGKVLEYEAAQRNMDLTVNVLYHENHDKESEIISLGGEQSTVTIATNMAGRGVDIKLTEEAREAGGLHIVEAQSQTSKRNSDQVKGRAARQGDPGSSVPILSEDDPYMGVYAKRVIEIANKLGDNTYILTHPQISKALDSVQQQIEDRDFDFRENTLEYDKVLDTQRRDFLDRRQAVLEMDADAMKEQVFELYNRFVDGIMEMAIDSDENIDYATVSTLFGMAHSPFESKGIEAVLQDEILRERLKQMYASQLETMTTMGFIDENGKRQYLVEEEAKMLLEKVEETLDKGKLPSKHVVPREYRDDVPIPLDPQVIGAARQKLSDDEFVEFLKKGYSATLNAMVNSNVLPSEVGVQAYEDIAAQLEAGRETLKTAGKLNLPTVLPLMRRDMVNVPYSYDCTMELQLEALEEEQLYQTLIGHITSAYEARGTPEEQLDMSRRVMLDVMDNQWRDHLGDLETLKTQVRHPRMDPKQQFALDGSNIYEWMKDEVEQNFAVNYFRQVRPTKAEE